MRFVNNNNIYTYSYYTYNTYQILYVSKMNINSNY